MKGLNFPGVRNLDFVKWALGLGIIALYYFSYALLVMSHLMFVTKILNTIIGFILFFSALVLTFNFKNMV